MNLHKERVMARVKENYAAYLADFTPTAVDDKPMGPWAFTIKEATRLLDLEEEPVKAEVEAHRQRLSQGAQAALPESWEPAFLVREYGREGAQQKVSELAV